MAQRNVDVAIAGGGLAGGLIALALTRQHPQLDLALVEGGERLGGKHRWSWFGSDLDDSGERLLCAFPVTRWSGHYSVRFPAYERTLRAHYNSLASEDFAFTLERELNQGSVLTGCHIAELDAGGLTLADGDRINARLVIDCRGLTDAPQLTGGWQVFLGQEWQLDRPHGLTGPVIMDATVKQEGAYRFTYLLPLGPDRLFLEDTYYADTPRLERDVLRARIADYVREHGWSGQPVDEETGVLPVITGGDFAAFQAAHRTPGVAVAGARGGFVHPLTSYTVPQAVRVAGLIASEIGRGDKELSALLETEAKAHWQATGFYRLLGQMLFGAADPAERYRVFQRFYRLSEPLIERFYAAQSTWVDRARVLAGKPPVRITRALHAITSQSPPLAYRSEQPHV